MSKECTKLSEIRNLILGLQLTVNPFEEDVLRCAKLEFSEGHKKTGYIYYCVNNPQYLVRKPLEIMKPLLFPYQKTKFK